MIKYWYFIRFPKSLGTSAVIYRVKVGESWRDFCKLRLLQEFARDCSHYLMPESDVSELDMDIFHAKVFGDVPRTQGTFRQTTLPVADLYAYIMNGLLGKFEDNIPGPVGISCAMNQHKQSYSDMHNPIKNVKLAPTPKRKYLSSGRFAGFLGRFIPAWLVLNWYALTWDL